MACLGEILDLVEDQAESEQSESSGGLSDIFDLVDPGPAQRDGYKVKDSPHARSHCSMMRMAKCVRRRPASAYAQSQVAHGPIATMCIASIAIALHSTCHHSHYLASSFPLSCGRTAGGIIST